MPEQSREQSDSPQPQRPSHRGPFRVTDEERAWLGAALGGLTPQQLMVLDGVLRLRCAKEIAGELGLRVLTVSRYIASMCERANVSDGARGLLLRASELINQKRLDNYNQDESGGRGEPPSNPPKAPTP